MNEVVLFVVSVMSKAMKDLMIDGRLLPISPYSCS